MPHTLCNLPENFTREIRYILIYDAATYRFSQALRGDQPAPEGYLLKVYLHHPSPYSRTLTIKEQNHNDYTEVKITFPIYDLSRESRALLQGYHRKRKYTVALVSEQEILTLGNHREPFTLTVQDHTLDNGTGKDILQCTLSGQTIVRPTTTRNTPRFKVLFFVPPIQ